MDRLEFKPDRGKLVRLFVLAIGMVAMCFFCTTLDGVAVKVIGWIGVAFFSLAFYTIPKAWFNSNSPVIIFSAEGVEDRQGGFGLIPWNDIKSFQIHNVSGTKMLGVVLWDEEEYLSRVSRSRRTACASNKALGFPIVTLGFTGLKPGIKQAVRFCESCDKRQTGPS